MFEHINDVRKPWSEALRIVGGGGLKLSLVGPASELNKLRPVFSPHNTIFWELDSMAYWK